MTTAELLAQLEVIRERAHELVGAIEAIQHNVSVDDLARVERELEGPEGAIY